MPSDSLTHRCVMDGRAEIHHVAVFQGDGGVAALIEAHGEACRGVQGQTVSGA